jgi:hypothetical protein
MYKLPKLLIETNKYNYKKERASPSNKVNILSEEKIKIYLLKLDWLHPEAWLQI